jgi:hypothetical protein
MKNRASKSLGRLRTVIILTRADLAEMPMMHQILPVDAFAMHSDAAQARSGLCCHLCYFRKVMP